MVAQVVEDVAADGGRADVEGRQVPSRTHRAYCSLACAVYASPGSSEIAAGGAARRHTQERSEARSNLHGAAAADVLTACWRAATVCATENVCAPLGTY